MGRYGHVKEIEGFFIDPAGNVPFALAELFCELEGAEMAAFFNQVQHLSSQWSVHGHRFKWRWMEDQIKPGAREMLKEMFDHTKKEEADAV